MSNEGRKAELLLKVEYFKTERRILAPCGQAEHLSNGSKLYEDNDWRVKIFDTNKASSRSTPMLSVTYQGPEAIAPVSTRNTRISFVTGHVRMCLQECLLNGAVTYIVKVRTHDHATKLREFGITDGYCYASPDGYFVSVISEAGNTRRVKRIFTDGKLTCYCGGKILKDPWLDEFAMAEQDDNAYYTVEGASWTVIVEFDQEFSGSPAEDPQATVTLHTTATQLSKVFREFKRYLNEAGALSFRDFITA